MNETEQLEQIHHTVALCKRSLEVIESDYTEDFTKEMDKNRGFFCNVEDKLHLLGKEVQPLIAEVIHKLKNHTYQFNSGDIPILSTFTSNINRGIELSDRLNNFKQGTDLYNGTYLDLPTLFNEIKGKATAQEVRFNVANQRKDLRGQLPLLFSVVKHCQAPDQYPLFYKYWKNMAKEVFGMEGNYESVVQLYATVSPPDKHIKFTAYLGTIGGLIAKEIQRKGLTPKEGTKGYKYLHKEVLNWGDYLETLYLPSTAPTNYIKEPVAPVYMPTIQEEKSNKDVPMPLNTILYGPPGCGKTYQTIDMAVSVSDRNQGSHVKNKERFDQLRAEGYIEFITFHQNYSYEDFVVGLRPAESAGDLVFRKHEGIFYQLCKRAEANYLNSKQGKSDTLFEDAFEQLIEPISKGGEVAIQLIGGEGSFHIYDMSETTLYFRKRNGDTSHTLSITTLKDLYNGTREMLSGLQSYYKAIIQRLKAAAPKLNAQPLRKYVLIIDEINRANMSKVFGELITLLEDDKRISGDNELRVTLPNGERAFGIPPNLYIIGTMNTADKSIAHIDIALRRRFDFIGMYPDPTGLSPLFAKVLAGLNQSILEYKKSPDFLIGHGYFMGRPDADLPRIIRNKVLPLLNEYFIGRTDIIKEILNNAGVAATQNATTSIIEVA